MPRGRPPGMGTPTERAAARRERIRLNVKAHRMRRKTGKGPDCPTVPVKKPLVWIYQKSDPSPATTGSAEEVNTEKSCTDLVSTTLKHRPTELDAHENCANRDSGGHLLVPSSGKQYTIALLGIFRTRLLPESVSLPSSSNPKPEMTTPCASWIISACSIVMDQEAGTLKNALMAISLAILSFESGRSHLRATSLEFYRRTLHGIRGDLQTIITGKCNLKALKDVRTLFLSCHAAAIFELFAHKSLEQTLQHVRGIRLLINHVGCELGFTPDIGSGLLEDYRMLEICLCLVHRCTLSPRPAFERGERQKAEDDTKPVLLKGFDYNMTGLLEIADQIPPIMVYFDKVKRHKPTASVLRDQQHQVRNLLKIVSDIEKWLKNLYMREDLFIREEVATDSHYELFGNLLRFNSFELAISWVHGMFFKLCTLDICVSGHNESESGFKTPEALPTKLQYGNSSFLSGQGTGLAGLRRKLQNTAHTLARALPYFLEVNKGATGRSIAIFPLEATHSALKKEMARLLNDRALTPPGNEHADADLYAEIWRKLDETTEDLELCEVVTVMAKEFGLPVFPER